MEIHKIRDTLFGRCIVSVVVFGGFILEPTYLCKPLRRGTATLVSSSVNLTASGEDMHSHCGWTTFLGLRGLPRKPVAHNHSLPSPIFLLLWVKVAHYYG